MRDSPEPRFFTQAISLAGKEFRKHAVYFSYQLEDVVRAKISRRLPIVLTRDEFRKVLDQLFGRVRLMMTLLYTHVLNQGPSAVQSPSDHLISQPPIQIRPTGNSGLIKRVQEIRKDDKIGRFNNKEAEACGWPSSI
jgi:hypothetical protein